MPLAQHSLNNIFGNRTRTKNRTGNPLTRTRFTTVGLLITGITLLSLTLAGCQKSSANDADTATNTAGAGNRGTAGNSADSTASGDTGSTQSVVTFSQADATGVWKFTISWPGGEFEACYDETGKRVSADTKELPTSLTVQENGAVTGKFTTSGGSGATTWTGTYSYSGTLSDDKQTIDGNQTYRRSGMSGTSTSEYTFSAVKLADNCNQPDTGSGESVDTESATSQDTGSATSQDTGTQDTGTAVVDTTTNADSATATDTQQPLDTGTLTDTQSDTGTATIADTGSETASVDTDTTPGSLEEAAEMMAEVHCLTYFDCSPKVLEAVQGTLDGCIASATRYYVWEAAMPETGWTIDGFIGCMAAMEALSCEERVAFVTARPDACQPKGERSNDANCLTDSQCASGFCNAPRVPVKANYRNDTLTTPVWSTASSCGVCADIPAMGADCSANDRCATGQLCDLDTGLCYTPQTSLGACPGDQLCEVGFWCVENICRALADTIGDTCGPSQGDVACAFDMLCVNKQCADWQVGQPGQACAGTCAYDMPCANSKCPIPPAVDGACNTTDGPFCVWPDKCVDGKCVALAPFTTTCGE